MRGRTKVISLAATLMVIFVSSVVFASGILNVRSMSLFSTPIFPDQTPIVSVSPNAIIKDYVNDPGYQIGSLVPVNVSISDAADVFSYQINVTWTTGMLNFTRIVTYGDFLAGTSSIYGTSRIEPTWAANYTEGWVSIAETVLGDYPGVSGAGTLFTMEFEVLGYGCATIDISTGGDLPTILLDNLGAEIAYTTASGYFKNKIFGDSNGDGVVTAADVGTLSDYWTGPPPGLYAYDRDVDQIDDGVVTAADVGVVSDNWLRSLP